MKMTITANEAAEIAEFSGRQFENEVRTLCINIRNVASAGGTEIRVPHFSPYEQYLELIRLLKDAGFKIGTHANSRNEIVIYWGKVELDKWADYYM